MNHDRKQHIIDEKIFGYSKDDFISYVKTKVAKMLKNIKRDQIDGTLLRKEWFSFKDNIFKNISKDDITVEGAGSSTPEVEVIKSYIFKDSEEASKFFIGDKGDDKVGGLIWNDNLYKDLNSIGVNRDIDESDNVEEESITDSILAAYKNVIYEDPEDEEEENEQNGVEEDEVEERDADYSGYSFRMRIKFNEIKWKRSDDDDEIDRNYLNPEHITYFGGYLYIQFSNPAGKTTEFTSVGNVKLKIKPPATFSDAWKESIRKKNDYGVIGILLKNSFKSLFSGEKTESSNISIFPAYFFTKNVKKSTDKLPDESNRDKVAEKQGTIITDLQKSINDMIKGVNNKLENHIKLREVVKGDQNKTYLINFNVALKNGNTAVLKIRLKIDK